MKSTFVAITIAVAIVAGAAAATAQSSSPYPDVPAKQWKWAGAGIEWAVHHKILVPNKDKMFRPDEPLTRARVAKYLYELYELLRNNFDLVCTHWHTGYKKHPHPGADHPPHGKCK